MKVVSIEKTALYAPEHPVAAEQELLLCCARSAIEANTREQIRHLLRCPIDWTFLVEQGLRHQLVPLLHRSLTSAAPDLIPGDIAAALAAFCASQYKRNQQLTNEACHISDALKYEGITALAFKGPALALQAFGDITLRASRDLDFLVQKADQFTVTKVLRQIGYTNEGWKTAYTERASWAYYGQDIFFNGEKGIAAEPHWLTAPSTFGILIDYTALYGRHTAVQYRSHRIPVLSPEDHLLVLCIHGCKEQWPYLRQVADIDALLSATPHFDWQYLYEQAKKQHCFRMLLIGLTLARHLLGPELPEFVQAAIEADEETVALVRQVVRSLLAENRNESDIYTVNHFHFAMRDSKWDKITYCLSVWLKPSDRHFKMIPLPHGLGFLYIPVKLIHDYLLLPVWLMGKKVIRH